MYPLLIAVARALGAESVKWYGWTTLMEEGWHSCTFRVDTPLMYETGEDVVQAVLNQICDQMKNGNEDKFITAIAGHPRGRISIKLERIP